MNIILHSQILKRSSYVLILMFMVFSFITIHAQDDFETQKKQLEEQKALAELQKAIAEANKATADAQKATLDSKLPKPDLSGLKSETKTEGAFIETRIQS